jgi:signal peptidase
MEEQKSCKTQKSKRPFVIKMFSVLAKIIGNTIFGVMLLTAMVLLFSLAYIKVSGGPPAIAGHQMFIVLSGSMNPSFDTGSMVFVKPTKPSEINQGEIITFRGLGDGRQLVSHRVVSVNNTEDGITFTTKGDANKVPDPNPVPARNLVGKVIFAVPYLGYFMNFAQTRQGIIFLVFIPAAILIMVELIGILKNMKTRKKEQAVQCETQKDTNV